MTILRKMLKAIRNITMRGTSEREAKKRSDDPIRLERQSPIPGIKTNNGSRPIRIEVPGIEKAESKMVEIKSANS